MTPKSSTILIIFLGVSHLPFFVFSHYVLLAIVTKGCDSLPCFWTQNKSVLKPYMIEKVNKVICQILINLPNIIYCHIFCSGFCKDEKLTIFFIMLKNHFLVYTWLFKRFIHLL